MPEYRIVTRIDPAGAIAGGRQVRNELQGIESLADRARTAITRAFAALGVGAAIKGSVEMAREFTDAMAEISTQIDETKFDMVELTEVTRAQALEFGKQPVEVAKAFYEIISAGAEDSAEAIETLTAANKLAVGGITSTATAADILTSSLNSYGDAAGSATDISDALFIAVRNGKTTVEEMASTLGRVTPIAAQAGVSFDELTASIAAMTQGGLATSEAVTAVRGILTNVLKPTKEAREQAALLGLEFSAAALRAKGLQGFLAEVITKTKGNSEALGMLFGDVQALTGVLALGGEAGDAFVQTLEDMETKAGATQAAFDKIAASPGFQIDKALANIRDEALEFGTTLLQIALPALIALNENFDAVVIAVKAVTVAFAAWYAVMKLIQFATFISGLITSVQQLVAIHAAFAGGTVVISRWTAALHLARAGAAGLLAILTPLNVAFLAVAAAAIYLSGEVADSAAAVNGAKAAYDASAKSLADVEEKARAAGISTNTLTSAGAMANPIMYALSVSYDLAADAAARLAKNARMAAIAVAQKDLAELQSAKRQAEGPVGDFQRFQRGEGSTLAGLTSGLRQYGGELMGGPSVRERIEAGRLYDAAIANKQRELDLLMKLPDSAFDRPTPPKPPAPGDVPIYRAGEDGDKNKKAAQTTFAEIEKGLMRENELLTLNGVERDVRAAQFRAEERLERSLTSAEAERVAVLVRQGDSLERGIRLQEQLVKPMNQEIELLKLSGTAREVRAAQMEAEHILGKALTEDQKKFIEAQVRELELRRTMADQLRQINGPLEDYQQNIAALNKLLAEGSINQRQFNVAVAGLGLNRDLQDLKGDLGGQAGYEAELQAVRDREQQRLLIIDEAQKAGLVKAQEYAELRNQIERQAAEQSKQIELERARVVYAGAAESFDSITAAMKDAFGEQSKIYRAAFLASKAFAIAEAIVKIQQGIAAAAANPFPYNIGAMASVAAATASIISNIKAASLQFEKGGYTGDIGRKQIAGVVHGQEFVVNAAATRQHRATLEAMNRGLPLPQQRGRLIGNTGLAERRIAQREAALVSRPQQGPRAQDRRPEQLNAPGSGSRTVIFNVRATDADSFARSERQMYNRANEAMLRAQGRRR